VSGFKVVLAGHGADELFSGYTKTDPILCFIDSLLSFRLKLALRFLCNYPTSICSPYSVLVCLKVVFSCYLSVVTHLLKYPRIRLSFFNKVKLLLSPLLTVRFSYLFLDSQLQSQLEPTDLASMFYSLECRIPLVSLSLMKEFFASVPAESSPGSLKFPLRTILQNDRRTAFLAKSFVKRGFQFAYVPALHGPFMDSMSDYSLRQLCLNKLLSMLK
jgi:asparagine synthetase B (glutamine-hydrolysing)